MAFGFRTLPFRKSGIGIYFRPANPGQLIQANDREQIRLVLRKDSL